jgi:hypothetical protein
MGVNKDPNEKRPGKDPNEKRSGENKPGKFHFNPGNQAGKSAEKTLKPESERKNNRDRIESRDD